MSVVSLANLMKRSLSITDMGGTEKMSLAECANLMLNTGDAKRNLTSEKSAAIVALFQKYQLLTERIPMDKSMYMGTVAAIYRVFDRIAPLEKYVNMSNLLTSQCVRMARNTNDRQVEKSESILLKTYGSQYKALVSNIRETQNNNADQERQNQIFDLFRRTAYDIVEKLCHCSILYEYNDNEGWNLINHTGVFLYMITMLLFTENRAFMEQLSNKLAPMILGEHLDLNDFKYFSAVYTAASTDIAADSIGTEQELIRGFWLNEKSKRELAKSFTGRMLLVFGDLILFEDCGNDYLDCVAPRFSASDMSAFRTVMLNEIKSLVEDYYRKIQNSPQKTKPKSVKQPQVSNYVDTKPAPQTRTKAIQNDSGEEKYSEKIKQLSKAIDNISKNKDTRDSTISSCMVKFRQLNTEIENNPAATEEQKDEVAMLVHKFILALAGAGYDIYKIGDIILDLKRIFVKNSTAMAFLTQDALAIAELKKERSSADSISKLTEPIKKEIQTLSAVSVYELESKINPFIAKVNSVDKELKQIDTPAAKNARKELVRNVRTFALNLHYLKNESRLGLQIIQGLFREFGDLPDVNKQLLGDMHDLNTAVNTKAAKKSTPSYQPTKSTPTNTSKKSGLYIFGAIAFIAIVIIAIIGIVNSMKTITYNKLVRDRIPEIIEAAGKTCTTDTLSKEEYLWLLDLKLDEELAEYYKDQNIEELADLLEVIHAAAIAHGYTLDELEKVRADKAEKRGGFEKRILLKEVIEY